MANVVTEFDSVTITNASIQFFNGNEQQEGEKFGCIGDLESETESKEIVKKCEGVETKKITRPQKADVKVNAHIPVKVARDYFGLSNEGLKPGVWAYGSMSKGKRFVFTADVVDEFEDITKMIAFANCANATGLKMKIENGADEVALLELEFTALPDGNRQIYYEAFIDELDDDQVKEQWHKQFTPDLVKQTTP
ncbi:phage tail protein [Halalkalibacterium halodurans]|uniref:phage tail protein n=1 Tax=Halalkalibacterium halodurans TaxID=86665 RepID=UPI002E223721|nr:phage tail protein [Halalkalibacterium halodurans]